MRLKIGDREYWMNNNGGYIWQEHPDRPATLGTQICTPTGSTIRATPEGFEKTVRAYDRRQATLRRMYG